ncbi:M2 family metallopeptidase [Hyalangium versicolor]|uniref:M2 family metallopeptidase n=1 Tax=Hyalangium versicolor TaxID=2861190 RepID=UPI001CCBAEA3|nr:M2 family metallopeptidase [Hyalangium versicolor]
MIRPLSLLSPLRAACVVVLLSALPVAAQAPGAATPAGKGKPTAADAKQFADRVNADLKRLFTRQATAEWIKSTYITDDTEQNAAWINEEVLAYMNQAIKDSRRFDGLKLDSDTARTLHLLRVNSPLAAPSDPQKRAELTTIAAKLEGTYGKGKACKKDKAGKETCKDLGELEDVMAASRNYDELLEAWSGWHRVSVPMRPLFERFVALSNEGAKEIGFANTGDLWKSAYDMSPDAFEKETQRLWQQVQPLYNDLHCYVRAQLTKKYGADKVPAGKPIPAHLLGNMWAQEWNNIYPLVEPYAGQASLDVTASLKQQAYDSIKMVKTGESFFTSLGLKPLPSTFWDHSMFTKPRDREVVCHASAWDVTYNNDLRIKMCIKPTEEDLVTIHHELGHDYYFTYYYQLPVLYQSGANDGFHEAIGDAITLSITPGYLKQIGLLKDVPKNDKNLINLQMKDALDKVAFLPFGLLIDQWRWDVFAGKTAPADYNKAWWALREKYQGISAPVARTAEDFDPGAKYHVPANVPYTRYFLARILQFQFHKAMCEAAGFKGPLHECSVYGNKEAGKRLQAMLELGASKPWQEALFAMTGQRQMDATPLIEYFAPLRQWLQEQNKGQTCGW